MNLEQLLAKAIEQHNKELAAFPDETNKSFFIWLNELCAQIGFADIQSLLEELAIQFEDDDEE